MPQKTLDDLLQLGHPLLYQKSAPILQSELGLVAEWVAQLEHVMQEIRAKYQFGRAIAAPQLGIMKRLIYMNIDRPVVFINPRLLNLSPEMITLWDDCMSFPNLLVRVRRHRSLTITYRDLDWQEQSWNMEDGLSELLQHEYDHLEGILCTMRVTDEKGFKWRNTPG